MLATLALVSPAYAAVIHVGAGESIQAAIDAANPGDTIIVSRGVFQEDLTISKDDLTLIGSGAHGDKSTILEPPVTPTSFCNSPDSISGICLVGDLKSGTPVTGVTIKGFLIRNFSEMGILGILSNDHVIENNVAENNSFYGIACFTCSGGQYYDNTAFGSDEAGFYQGDSPDANSIMQGNEAWGNGFGFFFRDAQNGEFSHNIARGNCTGLMFLDTGGPIQVGNWDASDNNVFGNNRFCPGSEEGPAMSGVGVFIVGGDSINIHNNSVWRNAPSGTVAIKGGIVVSDGALFGGAVPTNNTIQDNVAYGNRAFDLRYDQTGSNNQFIGNQCGTSKPAGLC
jgi:parallel beta-helix repeat protein